MSLEPAQDAGLRRDPSGTHTFVLDNMNSEMSDITNIDVVVVNLGFWYQFPCVLLLESTYCILQGQILQQLPPLNSPLAAVLPLFHVKRSELDL